MYARGWILTLPTANWAQRKLFVMAEPKEGREALEALGADDKGKTADEFDEGVWLEHIDALLAEMDGTTADEFADAVCGRDLAVVAGLVRVHRRCLSSAGRAKSLEGMMSVCAVVPDGYYSLAGSSDALDEVVKDACDGCGGEGRDGEVAEAGDGMRNLYAVVLLGQLAEHLLDRLDQAVSLVSIMRQVDGDKGLAGAIPSPIRGNELGVDQVRLVVHCLIPRAHSRG